MRSECVHKPEADKKERRADLLRYCLSLLFRISRKIVLRPDQMPGYRPKEAGRLQGQTNFARKKVLNPLDSGPFWQRVKDSNPHIQSQSLLCYLYTNPLYSLVRVARTGIIILENKNLSRGFLKKIIFADFSHFQGIFPGKPPLRVHHQKQISLFRK